MKTRTAILCILLFIVILQITGLSVGCSGSTGNIVAPDETPQGVEYFTGDVAVHSGFQHVLWGIWNIHLDLNKQQATAELLRDADAHYNITDMLLPPACDDCVKIEVNSFNPATRILDATVTLRNPTKATGYDVRGILYTNDYGLALTNADDWTPLFDIPGGQLINPFKAFAKGQLNRKFEGEGQYSEKYLIYIPNPPHLGAIKFAVDASFPGNCREPYAIYKSWQDILHTAAGSHATVWINVSDWQNDVDEVILAAPEITGEDFTQLVHKAGTYAWSADITNNTGALPGDYEVLVYGTSTGSGQLALYDYVTITITPDSPFNPVDVTSPYLKFTPNEIAVDGNYAYIAGGNYGFYIIDISDTANPVFIKWLDGLDYLCSIAVSNGYAYAGTTSAGLQIIDIEPPEDAHIVNSVEVLAYEVAISGGYAYTVSPEVGLSIIDIDPIEESCVVAQVDTPGYANDVAVLNDFAYVADHDSGLQIVKIDPPESAYIYKGVDTPGHAGGVVVNAGYAYVSDGHFGLQIILVEPPEDAQIVKNVPGLGYAYGIALSGEYMYITNYDGELHIVDIATPESAYIIKSIDVETETWGVAVTYGFALVNGEAGIFIIDVNSSEDASIINTLWTLEGASGIDISGEYVYAVDGQDGFYIIDNDPLESAHVVKKVNTQNCSSTVAAAGGYAYVGSSVTGIAIIDVDPPEDAGVLKIIEGVDHVLDIAISEGYAYATGETSGIYIIDIDPPESAYVVNILPIPKPERLDVSGEYAYIAAGFDGLYIIDINTPESAYVAKIVDTPGYAHDVGVSGGYAYVGDDFEGYQVIDIDPVEDAYLVKTLESPAHAEIVTVSGGYAYASYVYMYIPIIDIGVPESPYLIDEIDIVGSISDMVATGDHLYLGLTDYGLQVFSLF